jgi:hypothetical protein
VNVKLKNDGLAEVGELSSVGELALLGVMGATGSAVKRILPETGEWVSRGGESIDGGLTIDDGI